MNQFPSHRVDDAKLKIIQMESIPVTIFEEGVFGRPELLLDVYHHFGSEQERDRIQTTMKEYRLTHGEMATSRMLEVKNFVKYCC